jgi:predicted aconitase with swiveling domain
MPLPFASASTVSSTVISTVVSTEARAPPAVIASTTPAIETLSGASKIA